jgi:branched-chain amino acid transport system ATP-binding protein
VNLALTLADTAYFMEKGEIRFHGPTAELLDRPDVLRSVFLEGAATVAVPNGTARVTVPDLQPATTNGAIATNGAAASPRLQLDEVSKRFGGLSALRDVTVSVAPGEIVGFLGPNGAGKTTLFDVVSGFLVADNGTIVLNDDAGSHDLTRLNAAARARIGLGRSFQDGRLFPALTVAETVAVALERRVEVRDPIAAALHLPAVADSELHIRERVEQLLELLGITDFRDKLTRELSTGSRRVVDLACVLAHEPSVLLLDEPSSGIAQREAEALGPLLLRIRNETGASLLVIEHDVPLLLSIADRIVALDLGEVVTEGLPNAVVNDARVVASYLGTTQATIARSGRSESVQPVTE